MKHCTLAGQKNRGLSLVIPLTVGFSMLLFGCGNVESDAKNVESEAEKAVLGRLKDPDSAKFGQFTQVTENGACLTVNARNSMGGYTGNQQARLKMINEKWEVVDIDEESHDRCISYVKFLEQPQNSYAVSLKTADEVIAKYTCGACHKVAGQEGALGPDLTKIGAKRNKEYLRQAILDPEAVIAEGFVGGMMPATYGEQLKASEIELLVNYMAGLK